MYASMPGTVSKVSRQCLKLSTDSLSLTSKGRAKQRFARRWRRARLGLCRSLKTSPRYERLEAARSRAGEDFCITWCGKRVVRLDSGRQYGKHREMIRGLLLNHLRIYYLPMR